MIMTRVAYYVTIVSAAAVMAELLSGCRCLGPADWGMPGADTRWGLFCTVRSLTQYRARAPGVLFAGHVSSRLRPVHRATGQRRRRAQKVFSGRAKPHATDVTAGRVSPA